ncbi:hypothetical protein D3C85_933360 [compost metagenome]
MSEFSPYLGIAPLRTLTQNLCRDLTHDPQDKPHRFSLRIDRINHIGRQQKIWGARVPVQSSCDQLILDQSQWEIPGAAVGQNVVQAQPADIGAQP